MPQFPPHLDGLIVLGAPVNPQGRPGRVARRRMAHALRLWRTRYPESLLIITGGRRPGAPVSEAQALARWSQEWAAEQWGQEVSDALPPRLLLEEASLNTAASARNLLALVKAQNLGALGLVTDNLHMRRARFLFQRHWAGHGLTFHPLPVPGVLKEYWQQRRYWWLIRMTLREGGAWLKVLGQQAGRLWRR
jgi:uncharacterized SAM-binding protein YcdF (DUF218 family)